jgi:replicative DNA helicase
MEQFDDERTRAQLTASVQGAILSTGFSAKRAEALDLTIRSFSVEMTAESLMNQLDGLAEALNSVDSSSELSELESLRLQMAMDRVSKMMQTVSNIMKRISDTESTITQNLK